MWFRFMLSLPPLQSAPARWLVTLCTRAGEAPLCAGCLLYRTSKPGVGHRVARQGAQRRKRDRMLAPGAVVQMCRWHYEELPLRNVHRIEGTLVCMGKECKDIDVCLSAHFMTLTIRLPVPSTGLRDSKCYWRQSILVPTLDVSGRLDLNARAVSRSQVVCSPLLAHAIRCSDGLCDKILGQNPARGITDQIRA